MREKEIEKKLTKAVNAAGGLCIKLTSLNGIPDRLVLLPGGRVAFVEVKRPGGAPRLLQVHRHEQLRGRGFSVFTLDDPEQIPLILGG